MTHPADQMMARSIRMDRLTAVMPANPRISPPHDSI